MVDISLETQDEQRLVRQVTSAALRAALAWTYRKSEPRAWRELSRMCGVVAHARGPGHGPDGPSELVRSLSRPLSELLPGGSTASEELADLVLLDASGRLTDHALDVGCAYTEALFVGGDDPARDWLPSWSWQQAEQVQRAVFEAMVTAGDDRRYAAARRFLIEHPVGEQRDLLDGMNALGVRLVATYDPIPPDRVRADSSGQWWWPCPVCRWPMQVTDDLVVCSRASHGARFRVVAERNGGRGGYRLVRTDATRRRPPAAARAEPVRCLDPAVWRFIIVPGLTELELERKLLRLAGMSVVMWPDFDRVDLAVHAPTGESWEIDVKDHASPSTVGRRPPSARDIVVADHRRAQVGVLRRTMVGKRVWTISSFVRHVASRTAGGAR